MRGRAVPAGRILRGVLEAALTAGAATLGLVLLLAAYMRLSTPLVDVATAVHPRVAAASHGVIAITRRRNAGAVPAPRHRAPASATQRVPLRTDATAVRPRTQFVHPASTTVAKIPAPKLAMPLSRRVPVSVPAHASVTHVDALAANRPRSKPRARVALVAVPRRASLGHARLKRPQPLATPEAPVGFDTRPSLVTVPDAATALAPDDTALTLHTRRSH